MKTSRCFAVVLCLYGLLSAMPAKARIGFEAGNENVDTDRYSVVILGASLLGTGAVLLMIHNELDRQAEQTVESMSRLITALDDNTLTAPDKDHFYSGQLKGVGLFFVVAGTAAVLASIVRTDRAGENDESARLDAPGRQGWHAGIAPHGADGFRLGVSHRF
ncbi:MAG: hypothetical protein H6694_05450 [Candidatus Latescibacteria bacterium]|nr:hypothetical protein [Candidatus Latescibacterota bacterium]